MRKRRWSTYYTEYNGAVYASKSAEVRLKSPKGKAIMASVLLDKILPVIERCEKPGAVPYHHERGQIQKMMDRHRGLFSGKIQARMEAILARPSSLTKPSRKWEASPAAGISQA